ncbi:MAG: hypothetical protein HY673_14370 [Chloroflexi bacterium]|nr:hypothetical protein [Chloroflexota bacterium]
MVSKATDIWVLKPEKEDLLAGATYASITLPWTFNRMMMNTGSTGQQYRALNIAKGIVGQEVLRRKLESEGVKPVAQKKNYRDEDLFDLDIDIGGKVRRLDVKSINYYSDYLVRGREPLTAELIVENASYPGPDWRRFFPMLIPHTQIHQDKETYCFIIASSIDTRRDALSDRSESALTAFPYGTALPFLASKRLCIAREAVHKGFYLRLSYHGAGRLLGLDILNLGINGEWEGERKRVEVTIRKGARLDVGPFSCIGSFALKLQDYEEFDGQIDVEVAVNDFTQPVSSASKTDLNKVPTSGLALTRQDFCNLILPNSYIMYVIGWIMKKEFLKACRRYPAWVWPKDTVNKFENQPWSLITEKDSATLTKAGFEDRIQTKPQLLKAGWLKTTGKGGGACCYVFPNIGQGGGVKETNLYVLPVDLRPMDELAGLMS